MKFNNKYNNKNINFKYNILYKYSYHLFQYSRFSGFTTTLMIIYENKISIY